MARFLLLLHRPAGTVAGPSPEALSQRIQKYRTWNQEMTRSGKLLGGEKCAEGSVWLRRDAGAVRAEPGSGDGERDVISGYFLLQADDDREASEIAGSCPHLEYGGTIELRRIEAT